MATLLQAVSRLGTLKNAWSKIKHRPDSRGFDEITIAHFEDNLSRELKKIASDLSSGKYEFTPLKGVPLPKEGKKEPRPLKVPAVRDRVVQKAIELTITPLIKKKYQIDNIASYAYIRNKSVEKAILKIKSLRDKKYSWVYSADIEHFFDTVDIKILLEKFIFPCLTDDSLNKLIREALTVEIGNGEALKKANLYIYFPTSGIPQGGTLSPLFANVYLNKLDMEMINCNLQLIRYADDFVVMCKSESEAREADKLARKVVEEELKLKIHPTRKGAGTGSEKVSIITPATNFKFIGIHFRGSKTYPASKQFSKMVAKIKDQARWRDDFRLIKRINYLKTQVDSWGANYHYTDYDKALYDGLDHCLYENIHQIFARCGYEFVSRRSPQENVNRIGLRTFTQSLNYFKEIVPARRAQKTNS